MSSPTTAFHIPRPIIRKLSLLRLLVRLYVLVESIAIAGLLVGAAFWVGLAIDWFLEPSPAVRIAIGICLGLVLLWIVAKLLIVRTFARLSDSSMALLIERRYPQLREGLITTIQASRQKDSTSFQSLLLEETSHETSSALREVRIGSLFRLRPLAWKSGIAIGLALSVFLFAFLQEETFGFWVERMRLSTQPWPRQVQLRVEGFQESLEGRVVKVARDDDYELQVYASIVEGHKAPEQVEIRYRLADGRRGRDTMIAVGNALPGRDEAQRYRYRFKHVTTDMQFDVVGGDDKIRNLKLHVVGRPQIVKMTLQCEFPAYMNKSPQAFSVSGRKELPEGTRATCRVEVNKPLREVRIVEATSDLPVSAEIMPQQPGEFQFQFAVEKEDQVLLITMLDEDGVENREPYRLVVSAVADEAPDVSVQLRGIGSAITPQAILPLSGQVTDDHGVRSVWFEFQVNENESERRLFQQQPDEVREFDRLDQLDLAETDPETGRRLTTLEPGERLTLAVAANDAYDLEDKPHTGSSPRFVLEVVTESQLRSLLEKKELALRQRYEAIYEKMVGTRELLDRIQTPSPTLASSPKNVQDDEQKRQQKRDQLRLEGALQNVSQLAHETLGVAEGFQQIVFELVNNRVDTEQLKQRLEQGIVLPLREIGGQAMPQLEGQLEATQAAFQQISGSEESLRRTKAECDEVLEVMKQVLDRMLELESYNELVELLRGIVHDQEKLNDHTKEQRRQQLRGLLDD